MKMLREVRKAKGLTMKALGEMVGVSESAISQYENGKRQADYEIQLKLSDALDCCVDFLLRGCDGNKKTPTLENEDGREVEVMRLFRSLSDEGKGAALSYIHYLAAKEGKQ